MDDPDTPDTSDPQDDPHHLPHSRTFRDPRFIRQHLLTTLNVYYPRAVDTHYGGFIPQLSDRDGHVYDGASKHLVATSRLTFDFAAGAALDGPTWCRPAAEHGLTFLRAVHRDAETGGYRRLVRGREPVDETYACYGHAFVLLAQAWATKAGLDGVGDQLAETFDLLDEQFWEPEHRAHRSRCDAGWTNWSSERDQNPNMHACEATLAAYEATGEERYLDRAVAVAETVARDLADRGEGLVWEYYTEDWDHDWNAGDRIDGYQTGHQLEWAKLLVQLARHREEAWLLDRAISLFDAAVESGWDDERGGFVYTFDRDGRPLDRDRSWWVHAEAVAAAALLATATGEDRYWTWYDRVWAFVWEQFVDESHRNWYRKLTPENAVHGDLDRSPAYKSGYHVVNACVEVLRALDEAA